MVLLTRRNYRTKKHKMMIISLIITRIKIKCQLIYFFDFACLLDQKSTFIQFIVSIIVLLA
jgi:hypothetical protein